MTAPAPRQTVLPPITDPTVHAELDRLARRYVDAGGLGMEVLSAIGGGAENVMKRLPAVIRKRIDRITLRALSSAMTAASSSRKLVRDRGDLSNRLISTASGAMGGIAGLPGAMLELPLTVTTLMRALLAIAVEHGLDPDSEEIRMECLRVFADAGPLAEDDGTDMGLLAAKLSITGQTLQGLLVRVAPRFAAVLGQKLAAQATPVLGAVAGASINYAFARYYQEVARVHFGLLRLRDETGLPREELVEALRQRVEAMPGRGPIRGR